MGLKIQDGGKAEQESRLELRAANSTCEKRASLRTAR